MAHLQPENAVKSFLMNSNCSCFTIICPRNSQNNLRTHAAEAECCWTLLNASPSAAPCINSCWIISAIGLTWDYVKYVSFKLAALCFGTFRLKANVPKQRAANLMETSNLNFWRTVPEDRHCRQSSLKYQQPLRLKIILPFLFKKMVHTSFCKLWLKLKKAVSN